ncbi:MAG: amidohydrolase [Phycisphaerales bacterium JB043]
MSGAPSNLREAHMHIPEHGRELSCLNLSACASKEEAMALLSRREPDESGWVIGVACRPEGWSAPEWPTASELDEATGGRPCVVRSFDFHCMVASGEALRRAGITRDTPDPPDGVIERDGDGEPTGLLMEHAMRLVGDQIPDPTPDEFRANVRGALDDMERFGYAESHDMLTTTRLCEALIELDARGELHHTIVLHPTMEHLDGVLACRDRLPERVSIGGLKIFTDGTLNSRTASMLHPFEDPRRESPRGLQIMLRQQIDEAIALGARHDLPIVAHAIGDRAVRTMLDAIEAHGPVGDKPHRIEHAQFIDEEDVPRFARLGVVASMQVCHLLPDMEALRRLVPDRAHRAFVLRELWEAYESRGVDPTEFLWLGSDAPVVSPDPADTLQAALHRRRTGMDETDAINPEQALTREQTLSCLRARI